MHVDENVQSHCKGKLYKIIDLPAVNLLNITENVYNIQNY